METKQAIVNALRAFLATRPGFDPGNYGDAASYRADVRRATRQRHDAERLLRDVELRDSITADDILREARAGRVEITTPGTRQSSGMVSNVFRIHYTAGQYYCTEYRGAVARLLASVLLAWKRDKAMPGARYRVAGKGAAWPTLEEAKGSAARYLPAIASIETVYRDQSADAWVSAGDWLRASFRREYGRGIASRYFS